MMKKFFITLAGILLSIMTQAAPITEQQALQKAKEFLQGKQLMQTGRNMRRAPRQSASGTALYIFNVEDDGGFVIVGGDDSTDAILGYTTQGRYDETTLPENCRAWLEQTEAELTAYQRHAATRPASAIKKSAARQVSVHARIDPLIITTWNQGNSYNDTNTDGVYNVHLPMISGQYPCTGCVATAGAQVMYYYQWPQTATESVPGYTASSQANTSADLPPIQFQWDKMQTSYAYNDPNTEAVNAVADLMLYCGYAAQMNYGVGSSGASTLTLAQGMSAYFGYNPDSWKYVVRSNYSISEWDELIYHELASARPIIYSGSYNGGHAFICDGYDGAGMYHFNWGWGGSYNGYFKLQATNPNGDSDITDMGYIADNDCIIGLQPSSWPDIADVNADDTWEVAEIEGIVATASNVSVAGTTVTMRLSNYNDDSYGFGFGMGLLNDDGTVTVIDTSNERYKQTTLPSGYGFSSVSFDFSSYDLAEGSHTLVPVCLQNGETEWQRCKPAELCLNVEVSGADRVITAHPIELLTINAFELASGGIPDCSQAVRLNVTNDGDNLEKTLYVYVGTAEDKGKYASRQTVKIAAGNTKEYRMSIGTLKAGTHTLWLTGDYSGSQVLKKQEITIQQDLSATSFEVTGKKYENKVLKVDVTVENQAGDYIQPLYLFASTTATKKLVYAAGSAIESGSQETVTFYFQPDQAGTWNLWIATDAEGANVIGQDEVEITEQPAATLSFSAQPQNVQGRQIVAENMVINVEVTNTGENPYDDNIQIILYKLDTETNMGSWVESKQQDITLETGATTSINFTFDNLEDGSTYFYYIYYYSQSTRVRGCGSYSYEFCYTPAQPVIAGDANGDGKVTITDAVYIVNYVLQQPAPDFILEAADLNADGSITITDAVMVVNIILGQGQEEK